MSKKEQLMYQFLNKLKIEVENLPRDYKDESGKHIEPHYKEKLGKGRPNGLENLTCWALFHMKSELNKAQIKFNFNFGHFFPDISIYVKGAPFGLELKQRKSDTWITNGGSVFETETRHDYYDIFVFFGDILKKSKYYKIKYEPYWKAIDAIEVTHSPRYHLNMDNKHPIFSSADSYLEFRNMKKSKMIPILQRKLANTASKPTWYTTPELAPLSIEELKESPHKKDKIRFYQIMSNIFILFPQDLLKTNRNWKHLRANANYDKANQYLSELYFYSKSFRDLFSAGGKKLIFGAYFPRIVWNMRIDSKFILDAINKSSASFKTKARKSWNKFNLVNFPLKSSNKFAKDYKTMINILGKYYLQEPLKQSTSKSFYNVIFH